MKQLKQHSSTNASKSATKNKNKPNRTYHALKSSKRDANAAIINELKISDPELFINDPSILNFDQLPISEITLKGLLDSNYVQMTLIQKQSIPLTLFGKDLLGAAKTGSGKTLAFLIPALENLHKLNWGQMDGLGVLIISPTRELALQIFQQLQKVGKHHSFSAGLLIGGKDVNLEKDRVNRMNILVCTPGRLLQHMDQTPEFHCDNLQLLVLDEADRCLDDGFEKTLNAIIQNLPKQRQTLLFSATQTKSVKDLARLSLSDPEYVAVHEKEDASTPAKLTQKYLVIPLEQKLDLLFSFIRTHLKSKIIVFVSSCKQVRFIYETFCRLQPGMPLLCLFGKQKQQKRIAIFEQFCRKQSACLFATDVAARGLDVPLVDWVLQLDCPEDADTYIHRVGRTARYDASGDALLFLLPSEEPAMIDEFEKKKIPVKKIQHNPQKIVSLSSKMQAFCSEFPEIKYLAQKSFISYIRSVHLHKNKNVFDVHAIPFQEFAESLGLAGAPKISFVKTAAKNESRQEKKIEKLAEIDSDVEDTEAEKKSKTRIDKMFAKKNSTVLSEHYAKLKNKDSSESDNEEENEFMVIKRKNHEVEESIPTLVPESESLDHRNILKLRQKAIKERGLGQKYHFDDEGNKISSYQLESLDEFSKVKNIEERKEEYLKVQTEEMKDADAGDKALEKNRIKLLKKERKRKERSIRQGDSAPPIAVTLDSPDESNNSNESGESSFDYESGNDSEYKSESEDEEEQMEIDLSENDESSSMINKAKKRQHEQHVVTINQKKIKLDKMDKGSLENMALALLDEK